MPPTIVFGRLVRESDLESPGRIQLIRQLAAYTRVVYLEAPRRAVRGLVDTRRPTMSVVDHNVYLVRDALAFRHHRLGKRLGWLTTECDGRWLEELLAESDLLPYLYWLQGASSDMARGLRHGRRIYDCMDPNFLPELQAEFDRDERSLAATSAVVLASAESLRQRMETANPSTYLVPNASPAISALVKPLREVNGQPLGPGPVAGFLGTVDWRFDCDAVVAAARANPGTLFVVAGRVNADQQERVHDLRCLSNVLLPGPITAEEGDALVARFDVGLIPFITGYVGDAINPVKMYMYLAHGKPVVATDIAECRANPWVVTAGRPAEFAQAVTQALHAGSADAGARMAFAARNTWEVRATQVIQILKSNDLWRVPTAGKPRSAGR